MINNDTLYHYCSNDSFCSIINNQKIWLSSLSLSNDTLEGKLVAKILEHLSKEDGLDTKTTQRILEAAKLLEEVCNGLIAPDTLIRDNNYQLLRCHNESETNIQTIF